MKLVEAKDGLFVFQIAKRERVLLTHVLKMFPVGSEPVGPLSKSGDAEKLAGYEESLAEALAEQRSEHKRLVDAFLGEDGRFAEDNRGYRLRLTTAQMDWLLRVLNEVRVGHWMKLGRPEELAPLVLAGQLDGVVAMEICAFFQSLLLGVLANPTAVALEPEPAVIPVSGQAKRRAQLRALVRKLPEAAAHGSGRLSLAVGHKRFAWYVENHQGSGRVALLCRLTAGANSKLSAASPEGLFLPTGLAHRNWVGIWLDTEEVDWALVRQVLTQAYMLVAPRRLRVQVRGRYVRRWRK